ncbi:MAG: hypothetical protein M3065_11075, partial [Actinomycetota bacterium]|nr:hypothetical protein [Actinomycetota bacterium]
AAPEIVQRLGRLRVAMDLGGPLLEQAMALTIFSDFDRLTAPTCTVLNRSGAGTGPRSPARTGGRRHTRMSMASALRSGAVAI